MADDKNNKGQRNLILLGVSAIGVTCITLAASLFMYRDSGDIYLDRSRPGFLPEEGEVKEEKQEVDFVYPDSGNLDEAELDEYLDNLKKVIEQLENSANPYSNSALSDESLGIPRSQKPEEEHKNNPA